MGWADTRVRQRLVLCIDPHVESRISLALLCEEPIDLSSQGELLAELGSDLCQLIVAAPSIEPFFDRVAGLVLPRPVSLVASLHAAAGLAGALQSALLVCREPALLALDAVQPALPVALLRRLFLDTGPGNALLLDSHQPALPGRFRLDCLGPLSRALLEGEQQLAPILRRLRCSTLS